MPEWPRSLPFHAIRALLNTLFTFQAAWGTITKNGSPISYSVKEHEGMVATINGPGKYLECVLELDSYHANLMGEMSWRLLGPKWVKINNNASIFMQFAIMLNVYG